jgi:hypothetical protein
MLLLLPVEKAAAPSEYLRLLRKLHPRGSKGRWIRYWPWPYANHRKGAWTDLLIAKNSNPLLDLAAPEKGEQKQSE